MMCPNPLESYKAMMNKLTLGLASGEYSEPKKEERIKTGKKEIDNEPDSFYQDGIKPQLFKNFIAKGNPDFEGS
jgi:uncharacterized UBP type Zn finger protein